MKLALLARRGPFADLLAERLSRVGELVAYVEESGSVARTRKLKREVRRRGILGLPAFFLDLLALRAYQRAWGDHIRGRDALDVDAPAPSLVVDDVNDPRTADHVGNSGAEAVFVLGTGIIRSDTLGRLPRPVLNLHGGIVPRYRNVHSEVWAVLEDDIEHVGSTLLHLDPGIDSGPIADQRVPAFDEDDGFFDLRLRNQLCAIDMAVDAARVLVGGGTLERRPQDAGDAKMYPTPGRRDLARLRRLTHGFARLPRSPRR